MFYKARTKGDIWVQNSIFFLRPLFKKRLLLLKLVKYFFPIGYFTVDWLFACKIFEKIK